MWYTLITAREKLQRITQIKRKRWSEVVTPSTKKNLEMRYMAENGACEGKMKLAKRAKELGYDAIHDTVHEMAKDEARHGCGFKGLLDRYFANK